MNTLGPVRPSRRRFLATGGALVVYFSLRPEFAFAQDKPGAANAPPLPGSLKTEPYLDAWIRIDADGRVTVFTGKAELGQGIGTALIQVAAEELMVEPGRVSLVSADTERTPNEGYTAGSHSMQDSGTAIRHAAARVRELLLELAATRLSVGVEALDLADGQVRARDGRTLGYGAIAAGQALHVKATEAVRLREPSRHRIVGKSMQRIDIPAKVTGGAAYVQDLRFEGMLHARIVRPPSPAARLREVDEAAVRNLAGVVRVVRDGSFLAVLAQREYQAVTAMRALAKAARWDEKPTLPALADLHTTLRGLPAQDTTILDRGAMDSSGTLHEATYLRPYQMHASVGPSCALALFKDGGYTVWTHSQGVYPLREALAEMLGVAKERVHCIHRESAGCYGHNAADDAAADAALLARAMPGRSVRVQWMREDEHAWEPFGPPMIDAVRARLDAAGNVIDWQFEVWSNTHSSRPGKAGNLLAATHLQQPFAPPAPKPLEQPEGGGDRNAIPLYNFPNARVIHHFIPEMPLRVSALRSLGAYANVFALESFVDELARAAKQDPIEFRLRHLDDPRAAAVIRLASTRFGWNDYRRLPGRGRGFAFARYKNLAAYAAIVLDVEVQRETGLVRIRKAVAAIDSGEAVNPDGIRNQIEGGILQSLSWTLAEEVTFDRTRVTSADWGGYPILRFNGVPDSVDVHIIDRPGQPFLGTGEVAQGPTAAALANAVADATGVRFRQLPLSRARISAATTVPEG